METKAVNSNKNEKDLEHGKNEDIRNGEQGKHKAQEAENGKCGQDMKVVSEEDYVANQQVEEHHDSPHPVLVEENTPVSFHIDILPSETNTKEDNLLGTNTKIIDDDKNVLLGCNPNHGPSPSVSSDHDKGLTNAREESLLEHNDGSVKPDRNVQPVIDVPTNDLGSVKANNIDFSTEHEKGSVIPDEKPSTDGKEDKVEVDAETSKEHNQGLFAPEIEPSVEPDKEPLKPDTEKFTDQDKRQLNLDTETSTKQHNELVKPGTETSTDQDKRLLKIDAETSTDQDNGQANPDNKTSTDLDKGSGMRRTETPTKPNQETPKLDAETVTDIKAEVPSAKVLSDSCYISSIYKDVAVAADPVADGKKKYSSGAPQRKPGDAESVSMKHEDPEPGIPHVTLSYLKCEDGKGEDLDNGVHNVESTPQTSGGVLNSKRSFLLDDMSEGAESGAEEEQSAFMKELEDFFKQRCMEFKPPKFYGQELNCLKLWRAVIRLGGYEKVTSCKLWRQVGESFRPPKTCTTVSWTFRGFYEKALLDYERHKASEGELNIPIASHSEPMKIDNQASGSGRARRDAAARAMQGWHSQRLLGNGQVGDPIIKDKNYIPPQKREKQLGSVGLLKRKTPPHMEHAVKAVRAKVSKTQVDVTVVDVGTPADWVKINVHRTKDCFEVYALVPGLLREEVRVQSDPAGRLVISGEPENPDNPWGVSPFKKVVSLPSRIDPHQTSAVVTLNGQLFVRVPFEQ